MGVKFYFLFISTEWLQRNVATFFDLEQSHISTQQHFANEQNFYAIKGRSAITFLNSNNMLPSSGGK